MNNYKAIIPCGIMDKGLINFSEITKLPSDETINKAILDNFEKIFTNQILSKNFKLRRSFYFVGFFLPKYSNITS